MLLDGFPRTVAQAEALQVRWPLDRVVAIDMPTEALVRKGVGRRCCPDCGKGFNLAHIDEVRALG